MKRIPIDKNKFIEEYNKGLNDQELGKIFNCHPETIRNRRKQYNLDKNFEYTNKISKETLEILVNQNLSDYKIGDMLNVHSSWIFALRKKWDITRKCLRVASPTSLTKRQEEILIGHILGDGHLKKEFANVSGKIEQGYKQKEYAEWKHSELRNLCSELKYRKRGKIDKRTSIYYESYSCSILSNPELNKYYPLFYKDKVKYISEEIMELFTPLSLAVLFMDDGYKSKAGYKIATQCFNIDSINVLINKLNTMGLSVNIHKNNSIYIPASSKDLFTFLVKPYIIPSMKYKLH